jgi:hypothetical protein
MAAAYVPLPAWLALIVQVPEVKTVIVVPATVQTEVVADVYATVKLDEAVAESVGAEPPSFIGDRSGKVMVCVVRAYVNAPESVKFPSIVETTTSLAPRVPLGVTNETDVELLTTTPVAEVPPTVIPEVELKFVPVTVVLVPPPSVPDITEREATVGDANGELLLLAGNAALLTPSIPKVIALPALFLVLFASFVVFNNI